MNLKTKRTVISVFKKNDIDKEYLSWLNNKKNFKFSRHKTRNFSKNIIFQDYKNYKKNKNIKFLKFSINKRKIGTLILYLDYENLTMSLGILLGNKDYLGKGIAKEVCSKIVNYYLNIKKFNRIVIGTNIKNKSMIGICESLSFRVFKEINDKNKGKTIFYSKEKKNIFGVIFKDPGAANLIFHYINNDKKNNLYYVYSASQAYSIFSKLRKKKNIIFCKNFSKLKKNVTQAILGTGNSNFEKKYLFELKKIKMNCISVIDHVTAIKDRYIFRNKIIFPDIVWTFDDNTYKAAKKNIQSKVLKIKNYFLYCLKKKILKNKKKNVLLYLCEPHKVSEDKRRYDFESLKLFFQYLKKKKIVKYSIHLKLHPKENKKRYNKLVSKYKNYFQIKVLSEKNLIDCFKVCKFVFGLNSYALNLTADAGIPTFRCYLKDQKITLFKNKKIKNFHNFLQNERS